MKKSIQKEIIKKKGDIFVALPRKNVPDPEKVPLAQKRAKNLGVQKVRKARSLR